eukprot:COSAG06_NODE_6822_length_2758_cov_27.446785_1_plen_582_part_00
MDAAAAGGVHGLDPWLGTVRGKIRDQPVPASLRDALAPLERLRDEHGHPVNVIAVQTACDRLLNAPQADWHPDDWRHTQPDFPEIYALAIHIYTLPLVYKPLGAAMRDTATRALGPDGQPAPDGISEDVRACLPFVKLLDVAMLEAAIVFSFHVGQVLRGVKYAFGTAQAAHDPQGYFAVGRELHFFEFKSSSTDYNVMYEEIFCGRTGPRTVFTIQSCEGVYVKPFSAFPREEEVLFRPCAHFRVIGSTRRLLPEDLGPHPPTADHAGNPDDVQLVQLATPSTQWVEEQRRERLRESMAAQRRLRAELVVSQQQVQQAEQARQAAEHAQAEAEAALQQAQQGQQAAEAQAAREAAARQAADQARAEAEAALQQAVQGQQAAEQALTALQQMVAPNEGEPPDPAAGGGGGGGPVSEQALTFAYCSRKARGRGTTACFHAGGGYTDSPAVCGEVLDVAAGRPVYWKATVVEFKYYLVLGVIGNARPAGNSFQDPTSFGWGFGNQVWIAGQRNDGHGGWGTWQAGDVAVFKLEARRLSMRVRRLGDQTFTMDTNGAQNLRIHVCMFESPARVQLSRAEPEDEF